MIVVVCLQIDFLNGMAQIWGGEWETKYVFRCCWARNTQVWVATVRQLAISELVGTPLWAAETPGTLAALLSHLVYRAAPNARTGWSKINSPGRETPREEMDEPSRWGALDPSLLWGQTRGGLFSGGSSSWVFSRWRELVTSDGRLSGKGMNVPHLWAFYEAIFQGLARFQDHCGQVMPGLFVWFSFYL